MFYHLYKLLLVLYLLSFVYFVCYFPIKGTPLGEINTLLFLCLTGFVVQTLYYTFFAIFSLLLLLLLFYLFCYIQHRFVINKVYNELHFVTTNLRGSYNPMFYFYFTSPFISCFLYRVFLT